MFGSGQPMRARYFQVLADLALGQIANHSVETLTKAEYRRLMIGVQLVRFQMGNTFNSWAFV